MLSPGQAVHCLFHILPPLAVAFVPESQPVTFQCCCRRCAKRQGSGRRGWQVSRGGFCQLPRRSGGSGGHPVPERQSHGRQAAARQPADQQDALRPFCQHTRGSRLLSQFQECMRLEPTSHTQRVPHSLLLVRRLPIYAMRQALASILPTRLGTSYHVSSASVHCS